MAFDETFCLLQSKMKAPKNKNNDFGHYTYRTAEGIVAKYREIVIDEELKCSLEMTEEPFILDGWHYIKTTVTLETETGKHSVTSYAREAESKKGMDPSQVTGATISYARKYALGGLFAISDEIDPDDPNYPRESKNNGRNNTRNNGNYNQPRQQKQVSPEIAKYNNLFAKAIQNLGTDKATLQAQINEQMAKMFPNVKSSKEKYEHGIMILNGLLENEANK